MLGSEMLELTPGARAKLDALFAQLASVHDRENGNGRAVRNLLECAKRCQAMRLMELGGRKTKEQPNSNPNPNPTPSPNRTAWARMEGAPRRRPPPRKRRRSRSLSR